MTYRTSQKGKRSFLKFLKAANICIISYHLEIFRHFFVIFCYKFFEKKLNLNKSRIIKF